MGLAGITKQGKIGEEKMDKQHQRKGEKSNSQIGKEFEEIALEYFRKKGIELEKQYTIEIGLDSKKNHRFDLGNNDTIVECKAMRWTETENVPSAKMGSWNEAMYYFSLAPKRYKKIFFTERHYSEKHRKTLLEYYIDNYYHLIPNDVVLYDYDTDNNRCKIYTFEDIKHREKTSIKKSFQIKETIIKETSMNNDYIQNLWESIVSKLSSKPREIQTMGRGFWFLAHSKDDSIYIDNSRINKPSVELSDTRKIDEKELKKFTQGTSQNNSYIRALINHFEKEEE